MFADLSIRTRLWCLSLLAGLACAAVGASAVWNMRSAGDTIAELAVSGQAVRASMQADMLHDAVHAEVMAVALAAVRGQPDALEAHAKAITENLKELDDSLSSAITLLPDGPAHAAARAAQPLARAYADAAQRFVEAARTGPQAIDGALPPFDAAFDGLKAGLEASGDAILATADATAGAAAVAQ